MYKTLLLGALFMVIIGLSTAPAFAQYMGQGGTGGSGEGGVSYPKMSLEDTLELAKRKVEYAGNNPGAGSGTPYMNADGVLGASAIAAAIFGGIAGAFFFRGRSGKYAAQGRG
jgi:hypothetical protein|tara:strand:- start:118 stop:456 length:339 start_codon:yes stop_codon:yes gene_type:complete